MYRIFEALADQWIYDVETLSNGWVLWTVFPAVFYVGFMLLKWLVLTCPVWMPISIIASSFNNKKD